MRVIDIPEIEKLSIPEKILLVEDLWDKISFEESAVPVPESHMRELDRRLARHKSGPGELLSLDELQKKIESRNGIILGNTGEL
jgi:putative addiction module component (TIGR02574 family)